MASYKACNDPQCKKHHIRHPTCKKPECTICSTHNGPILCDEMIMDTGEIIPLTQRERDIDTILRYFYTTCSQEVLDVHSLTHTVTEHRKIKPDIPINIYTRFCLNTAKSKFSLVSPVAV